MFHLSVFTHTNSAGSPIKAQLDDQFSVPKSKLISASENKDVAKIQHLDPSMNLYIMGDLGHKTQKQTVLLLYCPLIHFWLKVEQKKISIFDWKLKKLEIAF